MRRDLRRPDVKAVVDAVDLDQTDHMQARGASRKQMRRANALRLDLRLALGRRDGEDAGSKHKLADWKVIHGITLSNGRNLR